MRKQPSSTWTFQLPSTICGSGAKLQLCIHGSGDSRKETRQVDAGSDDCCKTPVQENISHRHRWCLVIVGAGGAVVLLLLGAAIACNFERVIAFQRFSNETEDDSQKTMIKLRTFFCKPLDDSATECRLCPVNWLLHKNKCYWISKEKQTWHKSLEDCREKHTQMLVIQSPEEKSFMWEMISEGQKLPWLGLRTTSSGRKWSWIDGSPVNDTTLQSLGPPESNSCGMLKNNQITSQACAALAEWICETEALLL